MSQDTEVIKATFEELKKYNEARFSYPNTTNTTPKDFCEYLKFTHKFKAKNVIADISGMELTGTPELDLSGIDFGNIIVGEVDGKTTKFQNCKLEGAKIKSNASMKGVSFTHCKMHNMTIAADISGVNFGVGSDIANINLREAYNIDQCIIDPGCSVSNVQLAFPDKETFQKHMEEKLNKQVKDGNAIVLRDTESEYRDTHTPKAPKVETPASNAPGRVLNIGIPVMVKATFNAFVGLINFGEQATSTVASAAQAALTTNVTIGAPKPDDPVELHKAAIMRIMDSEPDFSPTVKRLSSSDVYNITREDVLEWVQSNGGVGLDESISLNGFIRTKNDLDMSVVPHLNNLDLKGINFEGLDFDDVAISKCDMSGCKFSGCVLDKASIRDCNFDNSEFNETTAIGSDLTRCTFNGAKISKSTFEKATLMDTKFQIGDLPAQIAHTNFDGGDLRSADFSGAKVESTTLNSVNMQDVQAKGAIFLDVSMDRTNLSDADLTGAGIRDTEIVNSIAHSAILEGASLDKVKMENVTAHGIDLDRTEQRDLTIKKCDLSYGTMNEAVVANLQIDTSKMVNFQAQQLNNPSELAKDSQEDRRKIQEQNTQRGYFAPALSSKGAEVVSETEADAKSVVANLHLDESQIGEIQDQHQQFITSSDVKREAGKITITNTNARGIDISGGYLKDLTVQGADMSHAKGQNAVIQKGDFKDVNLHAADLSGNSKGDTQILNTKMKRVNGTDAKLKRVKFQGGEWEDLNISGANLFESQLGTPDHKLDMHNVKGDVATTLSGVSTEVIDTKKPDQVATVHLKDSNNVSQDITPAALAEKNTREDAINGSLGTQVVHSVASRTRDVVSAATGAVNNVAEGLQKRTKSKLGLAVGILGGVAAGGIIAGVAASTFGLGLIPMAIVAATTIGAGAIGGGVAGSLIQNTNTGRGILAIATAGVASMVLGPVGLVAAPVVALYNTITGKNSSLRYNMGSALKTFVAKPLSGISNFVAGVVPTEQEVIAAQDAQVARNQADTKVAEERAALVQEKPKEHDQKIDIAKTVTASEDIKPKTAPLDKTKSQEHSKSKGWANKFKKSASTVMDKLKPKKKQSFTESVAQGANTVRETSM